MNDALAFCKAVFNEKGEPTDFITIDVNLAFKRLIHMSEKQILNKTISAFMPYINDTDIDWMEKYRQVILTRKSLTMEKYIPALNKWLIFNVYSPQKNYLVLAIKDITWRKKVEEALRQEEKKYKKLANSITDPFFALDSSLKIIYWNHHVKKQLESAPPMFWVSISLRFSPKPRQPAKSQAFIWML
jgi:PAS domain-containing protein